MGKKRNFDLAAMPWWKRLGVGAFLSMAGLGGPSLLLLLITAVGGRYQPTRGGGQQDMWLLSLLYPIGAAVGGAIAFVFGPLTKRAWQAGLIGAMAILPIGLLIGVADDPRGPGAHSLEWGIAAVGAILIGVPAGIIIFRSDPQPRQPSGRGRN